ncbi:PE-PGRS family protein [Streptomyces sp. NPDC048416]|uniref:PE-PGRS family protein n=1 Tax=Streptomyces sp. NPDC048416 TaxID=3365546 RepID=UPI003719118A
MGDTRSVNPEHLEGLAKLIDGHGGVQDRVDEAFTRASRLGVTSKLSSLGPMRSWLKDTAPDLRKRATIARLDDGDPEAGLRWAGFSAEDLKKYEGDLLTPDAILLANSLAASGDAHAYEFKRQPDESLNDWIQRMESHAITRIPGLQPHEQTVNTLLGLFGDWSSITKATAVVTLQGGSLAKVVVGNSLKQGVFRAWKIRVGASMRASNTPWLQKGGTAVIKWSPKIRSLSAPGSWLPGQLGNLLSRSSLYQRAASIPGTGGVRGDLFGDAWNAFRSSALMEHVGANGVIDFVVGSDEFAKTYGGFTHSGQAVARAGNASLVKVFSKASTMQRFANSVPTSVDTVTTATRGASAFRAGLGAAAKTAGFLRGVGIVGSVAATGLSAANVISQGNPVKAFQRNGVGYVADVAELGFNASMTAAMIAPNPVTIGLAVGTGIIYGGAKVIEHLDEIKAGGKKAAHWAGEKAKGLANGAKSLAKKANPMHWF